jgi:hypothetical protein
MMAVAALAALASVGADAIAMVREAVVPAAPSAAAAEAAALVAASSDVLPPPMLRRKVTERSVSGCAACTAAAAASARSAPAPADSAAEEKKTPAADEQQTPAVVEAAVVQQPSLSLGAEVVEPFPAAAASASAASAAQEPVQVAADDAAAVAPAAAYGEEVTCPVCKEHFGTLRDAAALVRFCAQGHLLCKECAVGTVTAAVEAGQVPLRCCWEPELQVASSAAASASASLQRCTETVGCEVVAKLVSSQALAASVQARFTKLLLLSSLPARSRMHCPHAGCGALIALDPEEGEETVLVQACPYCREGLCVVCRSASHDGRTCAEQQELLAARSVLEEQSQELILRTSKKCPVCPEDNAVFLTHYRGHGCHHMTHYTDAGEEHHMCFNCGCVYDPSGEQSHACEMWCGGDDANPCDCPPCPDCKPNNPCPDCGCDGNCPSCDGVAEEEQQQQEEQQQEQQQQQQQLQQQPQQLQQQQMEQQQPQPPQPLPQDPPPPPLRMGSVDAPQEYRLGSSEEQLMDPSFLRQVDHRLYQLLAPPQPQPQPQPG